MQYRQKINQRSNKLASSLKCDKNYKRSQTEPKYLNSKAVEGLKKNNKTQLTALLRFFRPTQNFIFFALPFSTAATMEIIYANT